ncbi:hypothetical protein NL108_004448 [Boleophthalmus pectinirostris]|nr:hypothetical protein NL108_004448 [Boleophthalmus pectinirostris]
MTGHCIPLAFAGIHKNHFFFCDKAEDEVDTDMFEYSKTSQNLIRCLDSKFLILNEENQFDLKDLNIQQQSCSDYRLYISIYRDLNQQSRSGRAVMLYALKDDRKYVAVCKNEDEVTAEEVMELQRRIEDSQHKALFYLVLDQQPNKYKFRSSLYPDMALGFDDTDSNKLILRPYNDPDDDDQSNIVTIMK